jgi:SAM-dependent methyltransferase
MARQLATACEGRRLLDYGCGDGTFVAMVHDRFPSAMAVDVSTAQLRDCARRLTTLTGLTFAHVDRLDDADCLDAFDVITCMEVLEHCPDTDQHAVLDRILRVAAPQAVVIISVPIETGLSLAAKHLARAALGRRGLTEYAHRERYRPFEFARMLFAGSHATIRREEYLGVDEDGRSYAFTGHRGFNWRRVELLLRSRFSVERRLFTPMSIFGAALNSQVWFVCRKR